jgi:HEAT repeat protein
VRSLSDEDDAVRAAAAWSLGKLAGAVDLGGALAALRRASNNRELATAVNAAAALARLGDPATRSDLLALASHKLPWVRANAAVGLGRLGGDAAKKSLKALLESDEDAYVRAAAARALGKLGVEAETLKHVAQHDPDEMVREIARETGVKGTPRPRDPWVHFYWFDHDATQLAKPVRYILVDTTGLAKAGYVDQRGESSEEYVPPNAPYAYELLNEKGKPENLRTLDK